MDRHLLYFVGAFAILAVSYLMLIPKDIRFFLDGIIISFVLHYGTLAILIGGFLYFLAKGFRLI